VQQQQQNPAQNKTTETSAREADVGAGGDGQPMKLGAPKDTDEPEAKSIVKSAADKARASNAEDDGPRRVISLGTGAPPLPGSYGREILTGPLPPVVRKRLERFEFEVKEGSSSGLTRVVPPPRLDAWESLRGLEKEFPTQGFALNYVYQPYRPVVEDAPIVSNMSLSKGCSSSRCYGRELIEWNKRPAELACAEGVKVGVIDTGFDQTHPAFKGARIKVVMSPASDARAKDWHGTAVLALLAGSPESSTPGFIPEAQFLLADAFFDAGGGQPQTDTLHLLEALERLQKEGARIINMSLVGPPDDLVRDRIAYMSKRKGVVFVAAAGNGGVHGARAYPAAYPEVIAVSAVDSNGRGYRNATRGDYINLVAPGVQVTTAWPGNKEAMVTGTSFSAPFVTAMVAVTYNNSPLKALIGTRQQATFDPKKLTMAGLFIKDLQGSEDGRKLFGQGLIQAPADCSPKSAPQPWAARVNRRLTTTGPTTWPTDVRPASFQ
jgi:hypothetical protein